MNLARGQQSSRGRPQQAVQRVVTSIGMWSIPTFQYTAQYSAAREELAADRDSEEWLADDGSLLSAAPAPAPVLATVAEIQPRLVLDDGNVEEGYLAAFDTPRFNTDDADNRMSMLNDTAVEIKLDKESNDRSASWRRRVYGSTAPSLDGGRELIRMNDDSVFNPANMTPSNRHSLGSIKLAGRTAANDFDFAAMQAKTQEKRKKLQQHMQYYTTGVTLSVNQATKLADVHSLLSKQMYVEWGDVALSAALAENENAGNGEGGGSGGDRDDNGAKTSKLRENLLTQRRGSLIGKEVVDDHVVLKIETLTPSQFTVGVWVVVVVFLLVFGLQWISTRR